MRVNAAYCPDVDKMPFRGGGEQCEWHPDASVLGERNCKWWAIMISFQSWIVTETKSESFSAGPMATEKCKNSIGAGKSFMNNFFMRLNSWHTTITHSHLTTPWLSEVNYHKYTFDVLSTKVSDVKLTQQVIETDVYKLGLPQTPPSKSSRLIQTFLDGEWRVDLTHNILLLIRFVPDKWSNVTTRSYPTIVDSLSDIGGVIDIMLIV